jgi:hypothetical protein
MAADVHGGQPEANASIRMDAGMKSPRPTLAKLQNKRRAIPNPPAI